jgi:Zn-dependent peptidase ImmA (M78 family)
MINNLLEAKAEKLLDDAGCYTIPVDVICLTDFLKIRVEAMPLQSDISGFLGITNDNIVIGYNKTQSHERRRFTIAHEIAHYRLHAGKDMPLFIDRDKKPEQRIMFRDATSSTGEFIKEREANAFAAALLMPKSLVEQEFKSSSKGYIQDTIKELSAKFQVSVQAMSIRLANLDIIDANAY